MRYKIKKLITLIEERDKLAMFLLVLSGLILSILTAIFQGYIGGLIVGGIILSSFLYYIFQSNLNQLYEYISTNKYTKYIVVLIFLIILTLMLLINRFLIADNLSIHKFAEGYNEYFSQEFNQKKIVNNLPWLYEDGENEFTTNDLGRKTLNTNSEKKRTYAMFQDLRKISGDKLLLGKFYLKEGGKIGIRFVNTMEQYSDVIRPNHSNECVIQHYKTDGISMGYGHQVTKRQFLGKHSTFEDKELSEGIYYISAVIKNKQFSCYYQKEGEEQIYQIIEDKDIIFENLGGPLLTKYIDDKKSYPELLDFKIYNK